ncbi:MAG: DUF1320 domain-containing protein [Deltaproteobacteria bacterium]|nr:DUF1320 domain-containing protein [Deltaproteobacteria bacterium]
MYSTLDDIKKTVPNNDLIQLTDDTSPPTAINQVNVDRAISDADELIGGYLRGRYSLPLNPVPGLVNTLSADISIYRLYARRIKLKPPDMVLERYKDAIKTLEQIQKGTISLSGQTVGDVPDIGGVKGSGADRVFTRGTLGGF